MQETSIRIPAGVTKFEISGDSLPEDIAIDCQRVGLLYRKKNVPNITYIITIEGETTGGNYWIDITPTPLKADNAIVTIV